MAENTPIPPTNPAPYLYTTVIIILISAVFFLALLYLRPQIDAVALLGNIAQAALPTIAAVAAYLKSQETHLSVNSRLTDFLREHGEAQRNEGKLLGASGEQARVAKQKMVDAVIASTPPAPEHVPESPQDSSREDIPSNGA